MAGFASSIGAIVMAFITMLTSLFGFMSGNKTNNKVVQDFEPKEEV